jgi:hypothetical protein
MPLDMDPQITEDLITTCSKPTPWDLGNQVLYDLCSDHFAHDTTERIVAKTWLIGRSYAVALERRRNKTDINDNFYIKSVVPAFMNSKLDTILADIKNLDLSIESAATILESQLYLTKRLFRITELDKRSFSSKYLHFHCPSLFFIYDTRAASAIKTLVPRLPKELKDYISTLSVDSEYGKFFFRCLLFQKQVVDNYKIILSPREIDNFLVNAANKGLVDKNLQAKQGGM